MGVSLTAIVLLFALRLHLPLLEPEEALYTELSREMAASGECSRRRPERAPLRARPGRPF